MKRSIYKKLAFISICCTFIVSSVSGQDSLMVKREVKKGSIITGTCLFMTPWLACLMVTLEDSRAAPLLVPVLGPYLADKNEMQSDNPSSGGFYVSLGISAAEAIGIGLVTMGIVGKRIDKRQAMIYPIIKKKEYGLTYFPSIQKCEFVKLSIS